MRDNTFSSVLLPAPFGPTMPITSPTSTRKQTSFSAQNVLVPSALPLICLNRRHGPATHDVIDSPNVVSPIAVVPIVYCFPSFSMTMASDDIGKPPFHLEEIANAGREHHHRGDAGDENHARRERAAKHAGPEAGNHPDHRIQRIERVPGCRDDVEG